MTEPIKVNGTFRQRSTDVYFHVADSPHQAPDVEFTVLQKDAETPVVVEDAGGDPISGYWPQSMTLVGASPSAQIQAALEEEGIPEAKWTETWYFIVPCGRVRWSVDDLVWAMVDWDDGALACRRFWDPRRVVR